MKKKIVICMGSSCFSRGNDRLLETIETFIAEHGLENQVDLLGSRCENTCAQGPVIKIDGEVLFNATKSDIVKFLEENLLAP
jgi:NADH:ubiquinone oxidoreductase subunit E